MISGNQEVSGFGPDNDTGDNWIVECESKEKYWIRGAPVSFRHVDTSKYLSTGEVFKFTTQNCGHQCPIMVYIYSCMYLHIRLFIDYNIDDVYDRVKLRSVLLERMQSHCG